MALIHGLIRSQVILYNTFSKLVKTSLAVAMGKAVFLIVDSLKLRSNVSDTQGPADLHFGRIESLSSSDSKERKLRICKKWTAINIRAYPTILILLLRKQLILPTSTSYTSFDSEFSNRFYIIPVMDRLLRLVLHIMINKMYIYEFCLPLCTEISFATQAAR